MEKGTGISEARAGVSTHLVGRVRVLIERV